MNATADGGPPDLAQRLRDGTWDLHREVERRGAMGALLRGGLGLAGYTAMLRNLHAIYAALEAGLQAHAAHPLLSRLPLAPLRRREALADDLRSLGAAAGAPLCAATGRLVARLAQLAEAQPPLLAAHAYVRYLGDLSGGQVLGRLVAAMPQWPAGATTRFYDFGPPPQAAQQAAALRQALAGLPVDEPLATALVAEARQAFARHGELFDEIAAADAA